MEDIAFEQFHQSYRNQRGFILNPASDSSTVEGRTLSAHAGIGDFSSQKLRPGLRLSAADWLVHNKKIEVCHLPCIFR